MVIHLFPSLEQKLNIKGKGGAVFIHVQSLLTAVKNG